MATPMNNTGNAVGSVDPRDLIDNAQVLDNLINGLIEKYTDRLGRDRRSWAGFEAELNGIITSLDSAGVITVPDTASGLAATSNGQYFREVMGPGGAYAFTYYRNNNGLAVEVANQVSGTWVSQRLSAAQSLQLKTESALLGFEPDRRGDDFSQVLFSGDLSALSAPSAGRKFVRIDSLSYRSNQDKGDYLAISAGGSEVRRIWMPSWGLQYRRGALQVTAARVLWSDLTLGGLNETTETHVRVAFNVPSMPVTNTTYYYVTDLSGIFTPGNAAQGTAYSGNGVSATSVSNRIQFILNKSQIAAAGYDAASLASIGDYLRVLMNGSYLLAFSGADNASVFTDADGFFTFPMGAGALTAVTSSDSVGASATVFGFREPHHHATDYVRFACDVVNQTGYAYAAHPVELKVRFGPGQVPLSACIVVTDGDGVTYDAQFSGEAHPNPRLSRDVGYHADGSLASGSVWIMASLAAGETKTFTVKGYRTPQKTYNASADVTRDALGNLKVTAASGHAFFFTRAQQWGLGRVTDATGATVALSDSPYAGVVINAAIVESVLAANPSIEVINAGPVFMELELKSGNQRQLNGQVEVLPANAVRASTRYRIFRSGQLRAHTYFCVPDGIAAGKLAGVHTRLNFGFTPAVQNETLMTTLWTNAAESKRWATVGLFANGDLHRDGTAYGPTRPVRAQFAVPAAGTLRQYLGWTAPSATDYSLLNWPVKSGWAWTSEYWICPDMDQTTPAAAYAKVARRPVGYAANNCGMTRSARRKVIAEMSDYAAGMYDWWVNDALAYGGGDGSNKTFVGMPVAYELVRYVRDGAYASLDEVYAVINAYVVANWGGMASLGARYASGNLVLQFASRRVLPVLDFAYRLAVLEGNAAVRDAVKVGIGSLAGAIRAYFNANGGVGLNGSLSGAGNSNSNATGARALALAIAAGLDTDGSYLAALTGIETLLTNTSRFMIVPGWLGEGEGEVPPKTKYLHYIAYAWNNYWWACEVLRRTPVFDMTDFTLAAATGRGGFNEIDFCISESRRGDQNTLTFLVAPLLFSNRASCINLAADMAGAIAAESGPAEGLPVRMFDYDPTTSAWNPSLKAMQGPQFNVNLISEIQLRQFLLEKMR